jgi:dTDP-4-amino-4,6-dideoxygalactose transaminase
MIPVAQPSIGELEKKYVMSALEQNEISLKEII